MRSRLTKSIVVWLCILSILLPLLPKLEAKAENAEYLWTCEEAEVDIAWALNEKVHLGLSKSGHKYTYMYYTDDDISGKVLDMVVDKNNNRRAQAVIEFTSEGFSIGGEEIDVKNAYFPDLLNIAGVTVNTLYAPNTRYPIKLKNKSTAIVKGDVTKAIKESVSVIEAGELLKIIADPDLWWGVSERVEFDSNNPEKELVFGDDTHGFRLNIKDFGVEGGPQITLKCLTADGGNWVIEGLQNTPFKDRDSRIAGEYSPVVWLNENVSKIVEASTAKCREEGAKGEIDAISSAKYSSAYDYYAGQLVGALYDTHSELFKSAIESFPKPVPADKLEPGAETNLTEEEILRLKAFAKILTSNSDSKKIGNGSSILVNNSNWIWSVNENDCRTAIKIPTISNVIPLDTATLTADRKDVYNRYSEKGDAGMKDENSEVINALAVAKYYAYTNYVGPTNDDSIKGCTHIESITLQDGDYMKQMLVSSAFTSVDKAGNKRYTGIPAMTRLNMIHGSVEAREAYFNLNYLLVIIADYAIDNVKYVSAFRTVGNTEAEINQYIIQGNTLSENGIQKYGDFIRASISIHDALDYLGVEPWFDALQQVYDCANVASAFAGDLKDKYESYQKDDKEPMRNFFNLSESTFAPDYLKGVALSATFKPMHTNMYEVESVGYVEDTDWVTRFHYPFGFYRKALYIDTDTSAAVNRYVTGGGKRTTRLATLKDMLEPEKDIVLYIDDRFYNTAKVAEMCDIAYANRSAIDGSEQSTADKAKDIIKEPLKWVVQQFNEVAFLDIEEIVKTGKYKTYSRAVEKDVSSYSSTNDEQGAYVLSKAKIDEYLRGYADESNLKYHDEYSPLQSFAVVSAIYRDKNLYNLIESEISKPSPVFVSSPNLAGVAHIGQEEFNSIYNYAMLKNLEGVIGIEYKTQLDMDQPLYMDIYGNILTDSGLVVIPAIANATLCNPGLFSPFNVGFCYLYNQENYSIPDNYRNASDFMTGGMAIDENSGTYELSTKIIDNVKINLRNLPISDKGVIKTIYQIANDDLFIPGYLPFKERVYLITEVLRGAPLDAIDKKAEGLESVRDYSKAGLWAANRLDSLVDMMFSESRGISLLSLPNLAYIEKFDYVLVYLFKIVFVALFVLMIYRLYNDVIDGTIGIKSIGSFIASVVMFITIVFSIPKLLDISYYQVNKQLMQKETQMVAMLNLEKQSENREIGVSGVQSPKSTTQLYLKVDDMAIPWYAILDDVLFNDGFQTVQEAYNAEFDKSELAHLPRFFVKGQNLFININDVFENSMVQYDADAHMLYNSVRDVPHESYITPYYLVLDTLIARINAYNSKNSIDNYDHSIARGGTVRVKGLIAPYLLSDEFMYNSNDASTFKEIYNVDSLYREVMSISNESRSLYENSAWYINIEDYDAKTLQAQLNELDLEARKFVYNNRLLLGRVSDDTFLKVMALTIACEHNDLFKIGVGSSIEIYDIDETDMIRVSLAEPSVVTSQASKSFARFVYDNAGLLGIVSAAILIVIYVIAAILKPICLIVIVACMIMSVVIRRLVKKDSDSALEGLLITLVIMCTVNILSSLTLKLSMVLSGFGLSMVLSAIMQAVIQVLYILIMLKLTGYVLEDWRNMGFTRYEQNALGFVHFVNSGLRHGTNTGFGVRHNSDSKLGSNSAQRVDTSISPTSQPIMSNSSGSYNYAGSATIRNSRRKENASQVPLDYTSGASLVESMKAKDDARNKHAKRR